MHTPPPWLPARSYRETLYLFLGSTKPSVIFELNQDSVITIISYESEEIRLWNDKDLLVRLLAFSWMHFSEADGWDCFADDALGTWVGCTRGADSTTDQPAGWCSTESSSKVPDGRCDGRSMRRSPASGTKRRGQIESDRRSTWRRVDARLASERTNRRVKWNARIDWDGTLVVSHKLISWCWCRPADVDSKSADRKDDIQNARVRWFALAAKSMYFVNQMTGWRL